LSDGLSFEIFEQVSVEFPVIFTTAYNEYAIRAFKVNSIDYLLKPIDEHELSGAVNKFINGLTRSGKIEHEAIALALSQLSHSYKSRFVIKIGDHLKMISTEEIAFFFSADKSVFIRTNGNRDYGVGFTLEQLESLLDPALFFRISRKCIVHIKSIQDIISYSNSRLKLKLSVPADDDILVSREKLDDFKSWLEGK
jgi:DNA-binding LytR/AlgR family response regulator